MGNTMTIMDIELDLPKPHGHIDRGGIIRYKRNGQWVETFASPKDMRNIFEGKGNDYFKIKYIDEFYTVLRVQVDDKEESKFHNRSFSMGIYIQRETKHG